MKNIQDFIYACFIILFNFMWPSLFNHGKTAAITYRQFHCLGRFRVVSSCFQAGQINIMPCPIKHAL